MTDGLNLLSEGVTAVFPAFAAYCCFYAGLQKRNLTLGHSRDRLWFACLVSSGAVLMVAAASWLGMGLAWIVTVVCARPYYLARFRSVHCECYGADARFLVHSFPWLLGLGIIASLVSQRSAFLPVLPSAQACIAGAWWTGMLAGLAWRSRGRMSAPVYREGTIRSSKLAPANVLFWGETACAACVEASLDLVSILQAFPDRAQVAMALKGYPSDAGRRFKGISIVMPSEMISAIPFEQAPSMALVDESGHYRLFEGLPNIRVGMGYLLRGF